MKKKEILRAILDRLDNILFFEGKVALSTLPAKEEGWAKQYLDYQMSKRRIYE